MIMKEKIIQKLKSNPVLYKYRVIFNKVFPIRGNNNTIIKHSGGVKVRIVGNNNFIEIGKGCIMGNIPITLYGDGNRVIIHDQVHFYTGNILCEKGSRIEIGVGTTIHGAHINAQEHSSITIGKDCMFSSGVIIRTSDSHPIYDKSSGVRVNPARPVVIGDHVWLSVGANVLKGVKIGDGAVVGNGSIVTHDVPHESIAAGIPAKIVKEQIQWKRKV